MYSCHDQWDELVRDQDHFYIYAQLHHLQISLLPLIPVHEAFLLYTEGKTDMG